MNHLLAIRMLNNNTRRHSSSIVGSLHTDATFTRVFRSEFVLKDLISSYHNWVYKTDDIESVEFVDRLVKDEKAKCNTGNLTVDVRCRAITGKLAALTNAKRTPDGKMPMAFVPSSYIVEVQHRPERDFPYRALQYACADISNQYADDRLQPVHVLGFCDFDFNHSSTHQRLNATKARWRESAGPDLRRCVSTYGLAPMRDVCDQIPTYIGNPALDQAFASKLTISLVMLPHVPRLQDLNVNTPALLRWASLVAHATPYNGTDVPADVRDKIPAVKTIFEMLSGTAQLSDAEAREEQERRYIDDGIREDGITEGRRAMLADLGVLTKADFERASEGKPVPEWLL